jgi:hypothetical protein
VVSLYDLELLTHYLPTSTAFLHYLHQRRKYAHVLNADHEIVYLAHYLRHHLYPDPGFTFVGLDPAEAKYIDANYPVARQYAPANPDADRIRNKWQNRLFDAITTALESSTQPEATDALMYLRDRSSRSIDDFTGVMHEAWMRSLADGQPHDCSSGDRVGQPGITFLVRADSHETLRKHLRQLVQAKKYDRRASLWIGLGALASEYGVISVTDVERHLWKEDNEVAQMTKGALRPGSRRSFMSKVGRNDPCPCGNGLKYKKCHGRE